MWFGRSGIPVQKGFCFKPQQAHWANFAEGKLAIQSYIPFLIHLHLWKDHIKPGEKVVMATLLSSDWKNVYHLLKPFSQINAGLIFFLWVGMFVLNEQNFLSSSQWNKTQKMQENYWITMNVRISSISLFCIYLTEVLHTGLPYNINTIHWLILQVMMSVVLYYIKTLFKSDHHSGVTVNLLITLIINKI